MMEWDRWQREVLDYEGNITIRAGRQVGKSEVISEKAVRFALSKPGSSTMIIAASQRQSSLLFEKVRDKLSLLNDREGEDLFLEKPTMTKVLLKNGSRIYCMPTGRTGYFIRGFTIDMLIADEAAYIPEMVWLAVTPMLAVSRKTRGMGYVVLLSTPFGKGGYFYNSHHDNDFRAWHVSSEKCPRIPADFLRKERQRMTKAEYRQEYLGEFTDEWNQFFSTDLIKERMTFIDWDRDDPANAGYKFYLGVDIARYGGDENALVIVAMSPKNNLKVVKVVTTDRVSTTNTIGQIIKMDEVWGFKKVFVDDGGVGGPVLDVLQERLGRRVTGLNNASRRVHVQGEEKKRGILKEDLYSNALMLLETGKLELVSDLKLLRSLKSITFEYGETANVKIFGDYSHVAEAMVRACWCIKERGLDVYIF